MIPITKKINKCMVFKFWFLKILINKKIKKRINNEIVNDEKLNVNIEDFSDKNMLKLSHGKKMHVIVKIV